MSLITRCPACETMFKVVPDQLRISNGWVRCGQCAEIFDAAQHMLSGVPATPPPAPPRATAAAAPPMRQPAGGIAAIAAADTLPTPAPPAPPPAPATSAGRAAAASWPAPVNTPTPDPTPPAKEPMPPTVARDAMAAAQGMVEPREPAFDAPEPASAPPRFARMRLDHAAEDPEPDSEQEEAPDVSFLRKHKPPSVWRRPAVRITLWVLALVLLVLLAVQVLLHERDRVAQAAPATRGLLLALCSWSGCNLSHPRQIESIVIDSSSFGRTRGDNYRLAFSLRNHAALDLAMPAIELALTDAQDQALVRRVILPGEFSVSSAVLSAGADWSGSLSLSVRPAAGTERIAGYRMLAFYP